MRVWFGILCLLAFVQTFDAAGNVLTRTDARGVAATFTYDALNRVTSVSYPNTNENIAFGYDTCAGGIGRLCSVTDANGTRNWSYDGFGRIVSETWSHNGLNQTTAYTWTAGDDLASVTYPSGRTVAYTRDAVGRVTAVASNGAIILSGRTYRADGLVKVQTWGNGITETKAYDLQDRMTGWQVGAMLNRTFAYDANGNVIQKDTSSFQYDPLDRLIGEPSQILAYDGNSNRLQDAAGPYSYTPASNRMATGPPGAVTLDDAGNTLQLGSKVFAYNQAGRLATATVSGQTASYTYRHDGLRASKTVSGVTTYFHYDLDGRLIAETDSAGATLREYIWDDSVPVAQIEAGVTTYLHTDQLGTPRLGTNSVGAQVWGWNSDSFGTSAPSGSVVVNLRFPGQYFDAETGLHQNWQRTFDPGSGRYLESDPIGLAGGVNTFGYVGGNPLRYGDTRGLAQDVTIDNAMRAAGLQGGEQWSSLNLNDPCVKNYIQQNYGPFVAKTIPAMSLMSLDSRSGARDTYVHSTKEAVVVKGAAVGVIKGSQIAANAMGMTRSVQVLGGVIFAVEVGAGLITGYSAFATTAHLMAANACSCQK